MSELRIEPVLGTLPQGTGHQATVSAGAISNLTTRAANDPSVFTITEKAPTSAFTFKTFFIHYAKWVLTHGKWM